jgi:exodeoxyribonuclease V gamma subunit
MVLENPQTPQPFFSGTLPQLADQEKQCELTDLISFFTHPTRFFMEKRLGVVFEKAVVPAADRELFAADALRKYLINNQLMILEDKKASEKDAFAILSASGLLPHGSVGQSVYRQQKDEVKAFMHAFADFLPDDEPRSESIIVNMDPFQVNGSIQELHGQARIEVRIGKTRPRDLIHLFLVHLLLLLASNRRLPQTSRLVCMDAVWEIGPINEAASILQLFLECFWNGLHRPLPFFEQSSYTYARQRLIKGVSHRSAMAAAQKQWQGDLYRVGEGEDPCNQRCFNHTSNLPKGFEETAMALFKPVFSHCARPMDADPSG